MRSVVYIGLVLVFGSAPPGFDGHPVDDPHGAPVRNVGSALVGVEPASKVAVPDASRVHKMIDDGSASFAEEMGARKADDRLKVANELSKARSAYLGSLRNLNTVATESEIGRLYVDYDMIRRNVRPGVAAPSSPGDLEAVIARFRRRPSRQSVAVEGAFESSLRIELRTRMLKKEQASIGDQEYQWQYEAVLRRYPFLRKEGQQRGPQGH